MVYHRILDIVPVPYSKTLLFIYPIFTILHLLISNSHVFPLPPHPHLASTNLLSTSVSLFLFCK